MATVLRSAALGLSAATAAASLVLSALTVKSYVDQQVYITTLSAKALEYNDPFVGAGSYNIAACFLALCCAAAAIALPSRVLRLATAGAATLLTLSSALALTIITATQTASYGDSVGPRVTIFLDKDLSSASPREYRKNKRAVAAVVLVWIAFAGAAVGAVLAVFGGRKAPIADQEREEKASMDTAVAGSNASTQENEKEDA